MCIALRQGARFIAAEKTSSEVAAVEDRGGKPRGSLGADRRRAVAFQP
jgi:hypothetical protein